MPSTEYDSIGHVSLGALAILYFTRKLLLLSLITFFLLSLSLSLSFGLSVTVSLIRASICHSCELYLPIPIKLTFGLT